MTTVAEPRAPHVWTGRPGAAVMESGLRRDRAQQDRWDAYDEAVERPPCPACGTPISDTEWNDHARVGHGVEARVLPYGTPDAREALFVGTDRDEVDAQIVFWRRRHPGIQLKPLAEGRDPEGHYIWVRFRQRDWTGRDARESLHG